MDGIYFYLLDFFIFASAQQVATSVKYWTIKFMKIIISWCLYIVYIFFVDGILRRLIFILLLCLWTPGNGGQRSNMKNYVLSCWTVFFLYVWSTFRTKAALEGTFGNFMNNLYFLYLQQACCCCCCCYAMAKE